MPCIIKSSIILHKIIENHFQKKNKEIWKKKSAMTIFFCKSHAVCRRGNGHWFSYVYIKTLYEAMVTNFLIMEALYEAMVIDFFTSRPSVRHWSLISLHQGPLCNNGHWFLCHIEALCDAMVINFFTLRLFARHWSLISLFTSRSFARQWSSISLHQDPLWGTGHWFLYIKVLCATMVIEFFVTLRPSVMQWSSLYLH